MYKIEACIPDVEIMQEPPFPLTLPSFSIRGKVLSDMRYFLGGKGRLESYRDYDKMCEVVTGIRNDEFPWHTWPMMDR